MEPEVRFVRAKLPDRLTRKNPELVKKVFKAAALVDSKDKAVNFYEELSLLCFNILNLEVLKFDDGFIDQLFQIMRTYPKQVAGSIYFIYEAGKNSRTFATYKLMHKTAENFAIFEEFLSVEYLKKAIENHFSNNEKTQRFGFLQIDNMWRTMHLFSLVHFNHGIRLQEFRKIRRFVQDLVSGLNNEFITAAHELIENILVRRKLTQMKYNYEMLLENNSFCRIL